MSGCDLVIIGASWGGLRAVGEILSGLPEDFSAPVVIVQHRQPGQQDLLTGLLDRQGPLSVREAEDKSELRPGCVLVAPSGYHVLIEPGHLELTTEAEVRFSRPSIDVAMETAAHAFGDRAIGVVLTGANADGSRGLRRIVDAGGLGVVQDPSTAEVKVMPQAAARAVPEACVLPMRDIAGYLAGIKRRRLPPCAPEAR